MGTALGIDIGGTGIKGAIVDPGAGKLLTPREKLFTPEGGEPDAIIETVVELITRIPGAADADLPVGIAVPTIVKGGRTMSAGNVSQRWVGFDARSAFESALGRPVVLLNDADAAAIAELTCGAAKGVEGLTILTTLGTGIGGAFLYNGVLQPNFEVGFMELDGEIAEARSAYSAKAREDLSWEEWAARLQRFYTHLERVFSPDLFVVGGGVSKSSKDFLPLLDLATPIRTAVHRNNAGIIGAAAHAVDGGADSATHR